MSESPPAEPAPNPLWDITRYLIVAVIAGGLIYFYGFHSPTIYVSREHTGRTMGTDYIVKVAQFPENGDWQKIADEIQDRLDALEQMLSTDRQDSDVSRFNAFTSTEDWFPVSRETAQVVHTALEISRLTEGAFDITLVPLQEQTGYEKLSVRLDPPALKKSIPELTIGLSAIANGFAVDSIAELLDAHRITDYFIEVGIVARGKGRRNREGDWIVGIEKPSLDQFPGIQQEFPLRDQTLAKSGSHPIQMSSANVSGADERASVSILAPHSTQADALTTAMLVLGEQKGLELANRHGIAVLFLLRNDDEIREASSNYWGR